MLINTQSMLWIFFWVQGFALIVAGLSLFLYRRYLPNLHSSLYDELSLFAFVFFTVTWLTIWLVGSV